MTDKTLTDADIQATYYDAVPVTWPRDGDWASLSAGSILDFARAIEAKIRAADREARPAPASVEAEALRLAGEAKEHLHAALRASSGLFAQTRQAQVLECEARIDRLAALAVSTPPAEAQPGAKTYCCYGMYAEVGHSSECLSRTPPASEARATGDAAGMPDRDDSKLAESQGLFRKFDVRRTDSSDQPGGKHDGCEYFVLDVRHDAHAGSALAAYADAVEATHPLLAADMRKRWALSDRSTGAVPAEVSPTDYAEALRLSGLLSDPTIRIDGLRLKIARLINRLAATGAAGEPQPREVLVSADLVAFLNGAAPLEGVWFGDKHPGERGMYWWRKRLPAVPQADSGAAGGQGDKP